MKKLILTTLLTVSTLAAFGQGSINVVSSISGSFQQPIFGPDPADSTHIQTGSANFTGSLPLGSTVYAGPLLNVAGAFTWQFWAGSTTANLAPLYTTTVRTATANKLPAGLISGVNSTVVPGVDAGQQAFYQIRVWNNQGGTLTTWAAANTAWQAGSTAAGQSAIVLSQQLGGLDSTGGNHSPVDSTEWRSFNIYTIGIIPEPTTFTLAGLGAAALLIFRRRK